jgi:preprotein translocase subunit SecF
MQTNKNMTPHQINQLSLFNSIQVSQPSQTSLTMKQDTTSNSINNGNFSIPVNPSSQTRNLNQPTQSAIKKQSHYQKQIDVVKEVSLSFGNQAWNLVLSMLIGVMFGFVK